TMVEPGPLPIEGETVNHEPLPDAAQFPPWQPVGDPVIVTNREPAGALVLTEEGVIAKFVHVCTTTPAWLTLKVLPAMVAVPDRAAPVFAVHETDTVADPMKGPEPLMGAVSHESFHPVPHSPNRQPAGAPVTITVWLPADAPGFTDVGLI